MKWRAYYFICTLEAYLTALKIMNALKYRIRDRTIPLEILYLPLCIFHVPKDVETHVSSVYK